MTKVAIIDIETTGFKTSDDSIVEIGIVELDLLTGETKTLFDSPVLDHNFDETKQDAWIFENSDLEYEQVRTAPLLESFRPAIQPILDNYFMTAFNKSFDKRFMIARGFKFCMEYDCIMMNATNVLKIPGKKKGTYKWPKVQEAWDMLYPDVPYIEKHRALDDAEHEAKILMRLIEILNGEDLDE